MIFWMLQFYSEINVGDKKELSIPFYLSGICTVNLLIL